MKTYIPNHQNEKLCLVVEGNLQANQNLLLVHGFGTNKDEGGLFVDISQSLQEHFRIIRFDFSSYGESEGKQEDANLAKFSQDLKAVLNWIKENNPGQTYILAHSLGCFVTAFLSPSKIYKTIFSGIPNSNTSFVKDVIQNRIKEKNGKVDEQSVSIYPRSSGQSQKIGSTFWEILKLFRPLPSIRDFAEKTQLLIIHPKQDQIIGDQFISEYKDISNLQFAEVNGDHNYSKSEDREEFIRFIKTYLLA